MHFTGRKGRNWYFHQGTLLQRNQIVLKKRSGGKCPEIGGNDDQKRERYLEKIPEEILRLFDQYEVPYLHAVFSTMDGSDEPD